MNLLLFHEVDVVGVLFEGLLWICLHLYLNLRSIPCRFISNTLAFFIPLIEFCIDVYCVAFLLGLSSFEVDLYKVIKDCPQCHDDNIGDYYKERLMSRTISDNGSDKEGHEEG